MDILIAKTYKSELQKKIAELLKEHEKITKLEVENISFIRQGQFDDLGNEYDFTYIVEAEIHL